MPLENEAVAAEIPAIPAKKSTTQPKDKASETVNGRHIKFVFIIVMQETIIETQFKFDTLVLGLKFLCGRKQIHCITVKLKKCLVFFSVDISAYTEKKDISFI